MKNKVLKGLLLILVASHSPAFSQQTINVSSNSATINGSTFDYSIGEMTIISTQRNANIIVTQGLLQPTRQVDEPNDSLSEIQAQTGNTNMSLGDMIKVYPNPTENMLNVESIENADAEVSYQLFDATGKVVINEKTNWRIGSNKISLDLKSFAAGSYYLMIRKPNAIGQLENFSYKIQKTN